MDYSDWRLPNRKELTSLIDLGETDPTLPLGHPFDNVHTDPPQIMYWSSTTDSAFTNSAWHVHMWVGGLTFL